MTKTLQYERFRLIAAALAVFIAIGLLGLAPASAQSTDETTEGETTEDETTEDETNCPSNDNPLPYQDLSRDSFAYQDIACLVELEIVRAHGNYRPRDEVTREEMAAFMARTYRKVVNVTPEGATIPFTDVNRESFAATDIGILYSLGVTSGTSATTFSPKSPVLRSHMALFIVRLYEAITDATPPVVVTPFTDITRRAPSQQDAIAQIYGLGITTGVTPTTFVPRAGVNREQMGSFVARLYRKLQESPASAPRDVIVEQSGNSGTALAISWAHPSFLGGDSITGYMLQWKTGSQAFSNARQERTRAPSTILTDLIKGTAYTFRVAAISSAGLGAWSPEVEETPALPPGVVETFEAAPGNTKLNLSWEPPPDNGGTAITSYEIRWTTESRTSPTIVRIADPTTRTHTITGLRNTTTDNPSAYHVWITASNAVGQSPPAAPRGGNPVSPTTVAPGLPTALRVAPSASSGTQLIVRWRAPIDDGGEPITSYRVERNCATATGESGWVTAGIPGNPAGRVEVANVPASEPSVAISGLETGRACQVRVRAVNSKSSSMGPWKWATATATPLRVPGPPVLQAGDVVSAHQSLIVEWAPPSDTGGGAITSYVVHYRAGSATTQQIRAAGSATTATIRGLTNEVEYSVWVAAVSSLGQGRSSAIVAATPQAVPAAPRNFTVESPTATGADGRPVRVDSETLMISWDPPLSNGTNPVTGYLLEARESEVPETEPQANDGMAAGQWREVVLTEAEVNNRSLVRSSLKDRRRGVKSGKGVSFDFRLRATNDHDGDGAGDNPSPELSGPWAFATAIPATQPANIAATEALAMANISVERCFQTITVTWNPPDDGGRPITHYLLSYSEEKNNPFGRTIRILAPANRHTLSGLKTNTTYYLVLRAVNAIGSGIESFVVSGTTAAVPSAPTSVVATVPTVNSDGSPGDGTELTVTYSAITRANGGPPIIGYEVQYRRLAVPDKPVPDSGFPAHAWQTADGNGDAEGTDFPVGALTAQLSGLELGASYEVRVRAVNREGEKGNSGYAPVVTTRGVPQGVSIVSVRINDAPSNQLASTKVISWFVTDSGSADVEYYLIRWFPSQAGAVGSTGTARVRDGSSSHTVEDLEPGVYAAKVSACNSIGCTVEVLTTPDTSTGSGGVVVVPER